MKRVLLSLTVGSIALTTVFQERAIAAYTEREFVQAWSKVNPGLQPFLGVWTEYEGGIAIYPSAVKNKVCIIVRTGGVADFEIAEIIDGKLVGERRGNAMFSRRGRVGEKIGIGQSEKYNLLLKGSGSNGTDLIGYREIDRSKAEPIKDPNEWSWSSEQTRMPIINAFREAGCLSSLPQQSTNNQAIQDGDDLAIQKFRQYIQKVGNDPNRSRYLRDNRTSEQKAEYTSFTQAWKKVDAVTADFLGGWTGYEDTIWVYPSTEKGKVCVVDTGIDYSDFAVGKLKGNRLHLNNSRMMFRESRYLGVVIYKNGQTILADTVLPNNNPVPLKEISYLAKSTRDGSVQRSIIQQFENEGCTTGVPEGAIAEKPIESNQSAQSLTPEQLQRLKSLGVPIILPNYVPQGFTISSVDVSISQRATAGKKYNVTYRNRDNDCFVTRYTSGGIGGVAYDYAVPVSNSILGKAALTFGSSPGLAATGTPSGESLEKTYPVLLTSWSYLNSRSDGGVYGILSIPEESNCTQGITPSEAAKVYGSLAVIGENSSPEQPIKPITPIAAANTYAYPSPDEFNQFKKTLKPSPITLSAADRQARTNFQTEWKQKNPAIASYVGAWKTADNQDVYVFPSKVAGRACVVKKEDGKFESALGVSLTTDMRYASSQGLFRVDEMTEVVAGRSNKSEPLSAFYGAIGSPELSPGTQEELDRAQCVSALPKGEAIVQAIGPVKPMTLIKPLAMQIDSEKNPIDFSACKNGSTSYKANREILLKCSSNNVWNKPQRSDFRASMNRLRLTLLNYQERRTETSTSTISMRFVNTSGAAKSVEVYDSNRKLKEIYFIDEYIPGASPGEIFTEVGPKIWRFIQGDSLDINGNRTDIEIENVNDSDSVEISSNSASKAYNNVLLLIEFVAMVSDGIDLGGGSTKKEISGLNKESRRLLAIGISKELMKGLNESTRKELAVKLATEFAGLSVKEAYTGNFSDLLKNKPLSTRIFLAYQKVLEYDVKDFSEKTLKSIIPAVAIDTAIEAAASKVGADRLLKASSFISSGVNFFNRQISANSQNSVESSIVLDDFSRKFYIRNITEENSRITTTYELFSDGTRVKIKEISYVEEWIDQGSKKTRIRKYSDGTIKEMESYSQGTGQ